MLDNISLVSAAIPLSSRLCIAVIGCGADHQLIAAFRRRSPTGLPLSPGVFTQVSAKAGRRPALTPIGGHLYRADAGAAIEGDSGQGVRFSVQQALAWLRRNEN